MIRGRIGIRTRLALAVHALYFMQVIQCLPKLLFLARHLPYSIGLFFAYIPMCMSCRYSFSIAYRARLTSATHIVYPHIPSGRPL